MPPLETDLSQSSIDPSTGFPLVAPGEATVQTNGVPEQPPAGAADVASAPAEGDAKMEIDPPQGIVKEEKMDVDEEAAENKENENPKPQILLSGLNSSTRKQMMAILARLGGVNTENPKECTHLVMTKLGRTNNMLMCLPGVKYVLGTQWMVESGEAGRWISEAEHMLTDPQVEMDYNFNLAKTLARNNRDKLFMGKVFYVTPSVQPSLQVLTNIITYSGGR